MTEDYQIIHSLIESVLKKMDVEAKINLIQEADLPMFAVITDEAGILIGENGQNLLSLFHILKKMADKIFREKNQKTPLFSVDINRYYAKKINSLKETAKMNAQRVRFFKKEIILEPMNSFERRIIHTALSEYLDIKTESVGEGDDRQVVIKPI